MPVNTIYLARHGFRLSWETTTWNSPTGTPRDPPLSSHGVDQARELATFLSQQEDAPQGIYSSPLYRCLQTATPSAEALELPIKVDHALAEWYLPVRRGLHPRSLPAEKLSTWFPLIDHTSHSSLLYVSQKGETIDEVHDRAEEALRLLLKEISEKSPAEERVVFFSHAATVIALSRALGGDRETDVGAATCSVSKFVRKEGSTGEERGGLGEWEPVWNGRTDFLERGEERHWDFSHIEAYEEDGILEDGTELPTESDNYKTETPGATNRDQGKL